MTVEDKTSPPGANRPATACPSNRKPDEDAVAVRVAVHIRPLVEQELAKGCQEILDVTPATAQIQVGQHTFTYDNVYGSSGGTDAVSLYPDCVQPLVDGLFKGYNATVFAYGQTGSGKTYTMGSSWSADMENQGVIPCVMDEMFGRIDAATNTDFTVKVSFVEIHKEEVRDLLWTNAAAPRPVVTIRELPSGVSLAGACERSVNSREDMSHVLMQGSLMRAVASTNMNSRSSRSHAIFTITLEQRRRQLVRPASAPPAVDYTPGGTAINAAGSPDSTDTDTSEEEEEEEVEAGDEYFIAKMHLVDLAGSERAKRTGAQGARLKEAININKGLLALAKVITALVENQSHIPYRDSKLTRLLQDSLGGNSRTVMIACVSPADINREESLNTLRYADRARRIKNKPVVNRDPVAAQLSALRQQIASLRAENSALKNALGGDAAAMAVFATRGQTVASEALQEAYDDLAVRCNALEVGSARQNMELDQAHNEIKLLRSGLLHAETERDQVMLRMEALQQALAESSDEIVKTALQQDAAAAAAATAAAASPRGQTAEGAEVGSDQQQDVRQADTSAVSSSSETAAAAATAVAGNMGVVATLRARVLELETELRQARSLQRMTSHAIARGMSAGGGLGSRTASTMRMSGGGNKPNRPTEAHHLAMQNLAATIGGVTVEEEDLDPCSPLTPARPVSDELDEPLTEVESDAEVLAQSAAHMVAREAMALKLAVLSRQMEAKQKRLAALQGAADIEGAKTKYMLELQKERDRLAKEKTELMKKLQAVEAAGAEERKKLEQQYRDKLNTVEKRLKDLAEKEKAAKRNAAQLGRVQSVCQQLQADISRMKSARAAVQRRMEAKEKEFREWRLLREREVLQLRRNAQRQNAALQQHQAMHSKQQAVLKRKTEEAEAARRKLRDLLELQAKAKKDRKGSVSLAIDEKGVPIELELQPNATAPLLRTEKARRDWLEQELELCTTSWQYQKVLEGELAQRAEATRKLREVQKQLMLLGGLVPPSPVVTAAAAAAAAANRGKPAAAAAAKAALPREEVLQQDAARLQAAIDRHSSNVKELQEQWERARNDEQSRGAGAADVRRWTGIRNIVEARELLRTLFVSACSQKAQVCEGQMEHAKVQEAADILQIKLDMAVQQAAEAKRKALEAEATTAAVLTTPAHIAAGTGSDSDDEHDVLARRLVSSVGRQESSSGRTAAAAAAIAAAAAASRHEVGVEDILGHFASASSGAADSQDHRDEIDIEADNLLHSMGLPPIMELPSSADTSAELPGSRVLSHSISRNRFSGQDPNTRYQALVKTKYGYWRSTPSNSTAAAGGGSNSTSRSGSGNLGVLQGQPSSEGLRDRLSVDGVSGAAGPGSSAAGGLRRPEKAGSLGLGQVAQDLAAKLDALEENWKGYKRNAAAGGTRRSITGSTKQGRQSYGSLPGSPTGSAVGSIGMSYGKPGSALRESLQLGPPAIAVDAARSTASLSACNSPVNGLLQPAGAAGRTVDFWPHQQEQEGPGIEQEDAADAPVAAVAKELNFMDAEADTTLVGVGSGEATQQQSSSNTRAPEHMGSKRQRPGRRQQEFEPLQPVDSISGHRSWRSSIQQQLDQQQQQRGDIGSDLEADSGASDDDEDDDPSYDPAIHGTPAVAHRGGRQASRNSKARNSRLSAGSGEGQKGPAAITSARVAGRWGARDNRSASTSRPNSGISSAVSAFSSAAGSSRSLAAQVSFNHEKRREWEKPVLEDINTQRAGEGLPPVEKLTIQLLKDCMIGKELDGKQWVTGAKTRDNLIAEYRRMMNLGEETDIDRITGAATWSMPSSSTSSGEDSPSGESPGGGRGRHAKDGSRSLTHSDSTGPALNAAGGARRIPANMYQLDTHNLPSSAPASNSPSPARRKMHSVDGSLYRNSPQRTVLAAAGRIKAGSPRSSTSGGKGDSDNSSRPVVSQSLDCSLLTAAGGAQRVPGSPVQAGALQESAQRSVQKSSSQKPMRLNIPASRVDGPYSCRLPSSLSGPLGSGDLELKNGQQTDRSNSRQGQPSWR